MKRVLCITANMNTGGAETFLMKIYRRLDKSKYQMDFCVSAKNNYYEKEIHLLGGEVYYIPAKSRHPLKSFFCISSLVRNQNYEYVMRVNEHSLSVIDLLAAKLGGAKITIMRSSNSASGSKLSTVLHKIFKFLSKNVPDVMIAPSLLAAEYTFGKKNIKNNRVKVLNNGLDIEKFSFSQSSREKIRSEFKLESKFVVGHIGRFNKQKNHKYLLKIFENILTMKENAILLMVGDGALLHEIRTKAIEMGIYDKCIFAGVRTDVHDILSAMDVFVFPSLYEGMPNTVIEAQTAGLPCMISNTITMEANVSGLVQFESINMSANEWAKKIVNMNNPDRQSAARIMNSKGYAIDDVINDFVYYVFADRKK